MTFWCKRCIRLDWHALHVALATAWGFIADIVRQSSIIAAAVVAAFSMLGRAQLCKAPIVHRLNWS
jgi:hypothetical protein